MKYAVPLVAQTTGMGCWAASIAMIMGWKSQACYDPTQIAANPGGPDYSPGLQSGLDPNDRYILERNGFELEAPSCYSPKGISDLLLTFGPLWIASLAPLSGAGLAPHIRVVIGMEGSQVLVNDP